jgi:hypothetical protein
LADPAVARSVIFLQVASQAPQVAISARVPAGANVIAAPWEGLAATLISTSGCVHSWASARVDK